MTRLGRLALVFLVMSLANVIPHAAVAHDGDGRIEVVSAEPRGDGAIAYRLRVVYIADGHGAPEATVTATVVDPANPQAPQPLTKSPEDGIYEGDVRFPRPGPWTIRFTTLRPTATLERAEEIVAPPTTTTVVPSTTTPPTEELLPDQGPAEPSSSNSTAPVLIAAVAAIALLVVVQVLRRRRAP